MQLINLKKVAGEFRPSGALAIQSVIHMTNEASERDCNASFSKEITRKIESSAAVAATDVSAKQGKMRGCWTITDKLK